MIAVPDPQEFVPTGRQQALRHPGPFKNDAKFSLEKTDKLDYFHLPDKFEKVSLNDLKNKDKEWWIIRGCPHPLQSKNNYEDIKIDNNVENNSFVNFSDNKTASGTLDDSNRTANVFKTRASNFPDISQNSSSVVNKSAIIHGYEWIQPTELDTIYSAGYIEEELYVKGKTVIWSRAVPNSKENFAESSKVVSAYTTQLPVKFVLWCNFYSDHPSFYHKENGGFKSATKMPCLCIVDLYSIRIYSEKGEDFIVPIPFSVGSVWNTSYGIFIEAEADNNSKNSSILAKPTLYSLSHPLDELSPVLISHGSQTQILNDNNIKIVFSCEKSGICMAYDNQTKLHSAYRVRKTKNDERELCEKSIGTVASVQSNSLKLKNRLSVWENIKSNNGSNIPSPIGSKMNSNSNCTQHSKSPNSMAAISRCHSPSNSYGNSSQFLRNSLLNNMFLSKHELHNMQAFSSSINNTNQNASQFNVLPSVCLEHVWTESLSCCDALDNGAATKVFLSDDFARQWYLCYLVNKKLSLVRMDGLNSFGMSTSISAKDAAPIPHLHLLAILEHNQNITLYSGMTIVGKLHIAGTLVSHTPTPLARRMMSPFPRRSSILPFSTPINPKFDEHLFSPVLPAFTPSKKHCMQTTSIQDNCSSGLIHLRDAVENRVTLQYADGTYYRITLPNLATSPLVQKCLIVLKECLTRDAIITLFTRWYSTRNSPGSENMSDDEEWEIFVNLLEELLGYEDDQITETSKEELPGTPSVASKKSKPSLSGSDEDWTYMCNSEYFKNVKGYMEDLLNIKEDVAHAEFITKREFHVNSSSVLFPSIKNIHFAFHLLYEDFKLDVLKKHMLKSLALFLYTLSRDLIMPNYCLHYWKDFPEICKPVRSVVIAPNDLKSINCAYGNYENPFNIMQHISSLMDKLIVTPYPYVRNVNERSRDILQLFGTLSNGMYVNKTPNVDKITPSKILNQLNISCIEEVILHMVSMKITTKVLDTFPYGIYLYFYNALWKCRENPPSDWPAEAYLLLWRDDLASQVNKIKRKKHDLSAKYGLSETDEEHREDNKSNIGVSDCIDGMEDIDNYLMKLRYPDDARVMETRKMLCSSKPVNISVVQRPDVSDHDFIEEQEKHLYAMCTRTMALPVGRGMFTLRTATPLITKPLPTPPLCLTGKGTPRGATIELTHIDTPANINLWPLFHNGVANGLRISSNASNIDNTWIVLNKPKNVDKQMEHGGFLMALGLLGHLKNLKVWNTFDYLHKNHEMISVGIILGLSSAHRGSCDTAITKLLALHIEALLPPTSMELDVAQPLQVAALLGIGLVYEGSANRHMTEILLSEIGRPPGPEMENSTDRESYSLTAGLALGLVTLKQGGKLSGLSDLNIPDTLHYYMTGGNKRPLTGAQRDKYKVASFQIKEGQSVNLDVTAPGATLALGLMYFGSGNKAVADWMSPPETQYLLDFIRPDFLMLRIISKGLIMWNDICPSKSWIENHVPNNIRSHCMVQPTNSMNIDYEAMNQAYCNIIAGASFVVGLKYAGSADKDASQTLLHYCKMFISLMGKSIAELAGKPTIETCLNVLLISLAMVMAGTGSIDVMRLVRHLRKRVGVSSNAVVTYGSHLAIHMALGLLFLGGGRFTISNSPSNVAALICAFYPKFPTHSNDNRYHLQAFRHFYVLAAEFRLVIPRDIHLRKNCYANIRVIKMDKSSFIIKGPAMLPDLNTLYEVAIEDERYWKVVFRRDRNWQLLINILASDGIIDVKQRAGCLSYIDDKFGYHSQLGKTLTQSKSSPWCPSYTAITSFSSNEEIRFFCDNFLSFTESREQTEETISEKYLKELFTKITYDAVINDNLILIPADIAMRKMMNTLESNPRVTDIWQFKLVLKQLTRFHKTDIISTELVLALKQEIASHLEKLESQLKPFITDYIKCSILPIHENPLLLKRLAVYIEYFDIPGSIDRGNKSILELIIHLKSLPFVNDANISKILEYLS